MPRRRTAREFAHSSANHLPEFTHFRRGPPPGETP